MKKKEKDKEKEKIYRKPSPGFAALVFVVILAFLGIGLGVIGIGLSTLLLLSWIIMFAVGYYLKYTFEDMEKMMYDMMRRVMQPAIILLCVGALIGTWTASGTVPFIIYHGLNWINPGFFYLIAAIVCVITSLATGTSWGTIGTVGVALIAVGESMGLPLGLVAASIICGAFCGDKLSPLSDTCNIASALSGSKLMVHIRHLMWTTLPAFFITLILFTILGLRGGTDNYDASTVELVTNSLTDMFNLGWVTILPAVIVIGMLLFGMPPVLSILIGAISGGLVAIFYQDVELLTILDYMMNGYVADSGNDFINELLTGGGVSSMWSTIGIILFACGLGGMLSGFGILDAMLEPVVKRLNSAGKAILATMGIGYATNMIGSSNLAMVVTATVMQPVFKKLRIRPENLSRTIEDSVTMSCFLIPWNTGAIYASGVLGVAATEFAPWCFLGYITPIFTIIYLITGFAICKLKDGEEYGESQEYHWKKEKNRNCRSIENMKEKNYV